MNPSKQERRLHTRFRVAAADPISHPNNCTSVAVAPLPPRLPPAAAMRIILAGIGAAIMRILAAAALPRRTARCSMLWREPKPPPNASSSTDEPPAASPSTTKFTSTSPLKRDGAEGWPRLSVAQSDRDGVDPRSSRRGATGVALKVGKLGDSAGAVVG